MADMDVRITADFLYSISQHYVTNHKKRDLQRINITVPAMNNYLPQYGITTKLRVAHFLAPGCVKTAHFLSLPEHPAKGGKEYDFGTRTSKTPDNTHSGDGPRCIGRGRLHLTDYASYKKYGEKLRTDLASHPEKVARDFSLAVSTLSRFRGPLPMSLTFKSSSEC